MASGCILKVSSPAVSCLQRVAVGLWMVPQTRARRRPLQRKLMMSFQRSAQKPSAARSARTAPSAPTVTPRGCHLFPTSELTHHNKQFPFLSVKFGEFRDIRPEPHICSRLRTLPAAAIISMVRRGRPLKINLCRAQSSSSAGRTQTGLKSFPSIMR